MSSILASPAGARPIGSGRFSLWQRILFMRLLVISGAIFAFLGFLFVAYGTYWLGTPPPPPPAVCYTPPCSGGLWWYQIVAIGIVLLGIGFLLALVGVAFKGPSKEWNEIPLPPTHVLAGGLTRTVYRCSTCGASLSGSETRCPGCGGSFEDTTKTLR